MQERMFERYKSKVYEKIKEIDRDIIPAGWWDTVIKYYFTSGYSEERAAHTILETLKK
jgi:hypothetical protein